MGWDEAGGTERQTGSRELLEGERNAAQVSELKE